MCVHTQMLACIQVLLYHSTSRQQRTFGGVVTGGRDVLKCLFFYTKVTSWFQQHKAVNIHSHLTIYPPDSVGILCSLCSSMSLQRF